MPVVVQVSDIANARSALKSIKNLREDMPIEEIEVVLHQEAIEIALSNGEYSNAILDLMARDIDFAACYNSMKAREIKGSDLILLIYRSANFKHIIYLNLGNRVL